MTQLRARYPGKKPSLGVLQFLKDLTYRGTSNWGMAFRMMLLMLVPAATFLIALGLLLYTLGQGPEGWAAALGSATTTYILTTRRRQRPPDARP